MLLMIDTGSTAYREGQLFGQGFLVVAGLTLLWVLTRKWRRPAAALPEDLPRVTALGRRRRLVLVLITVAAGALFATKAVLDTRDDAPSVAAPSADLAATGDGATVRSIDAPAEVDGYSLITGAAADRLAAKVSNPDGEHLWYYAAAPDGTRPSVVLTASTAEWDPEEAAEKSQHSYDWLFRNYFAGAKVDDARKVDPGPLGGQLRCGHLPTNHLVVCRWEDPATSGTVVGPTTDLTEGAALALRFRNAAEH